MTRLLTAGVAALMLAQPAAPRPETSVKPVTAAGAAYLTDYQRQFSFLLAGEQYTQRVFDAGGRETKRRTMSGESFLTFVPADRVWISVRDVEEVDGVPVEDREDLRRLLQHESVIGAARLLAERNARFNIGRVTRNFNEPTLGLLVLERLRQPRFKFTRKREEGDADATLVTLGFRELEPPTLVHGMDGRAVFASGELTIEAGSGVVRRTLVQLKYGPVTAQLTSQYGREPRLEMWVPAVFTERYEQTSGVREVILCEAVYTNYRRFDVQVRIK